MRINVYKVRTLTSFCYHDSGYLVSHLLLKHLSKKANKLNLALFYLKRYLRMTPTMMAVIGFGATMLRYFGSGPEWTNSTVMFDGWCRTNWWVNSLYLHNFININNMVRTSGKKEEKTSVY